MREVIKPQLERQGDRLPVSALPADGSFPCGTARWEKRNIAESIPVWDPEVCVQCAKCVLVCPHAVIRAKAYDPSLLAAAPASFRSTDARDHHLAGQAFSLQVAAEDCTGCGLCVEVCPARNRREPRLKAINMAPQRPLREQERSNWDFFLQLPEADRQRLDLRHINQQQLQQPLFEFSGACAGCGETLTSSWPPSSSATAWWWPMPRAVPRSTAAACPPPPGAPTARAWPRLVEFSVRRQR